MLTKLIKFLGIALFSVVLLFGVLFFLYDTPLPTGEAGPEADALATRMLEALNHKGYENAKFVAWSFRGGSHSYIWDKEKHIVKVAWKGYVVYLDLITSGSSTATKDGKALGYEQATDLIEDAQSYFNNDSFWLVAPYKVFDPGTERYLVQLEDGAEGLLVTYTQGGDTPGDSYLWLLDQSGIPTSFKLWVRIIPIDGLEVTWDGWKKTDSGALLPASHSFGPITMSLGEVKAY